LTLRRALLVRAGALGDVLLLRRAVCALHRNGWSAALLAPARTGAVLVGPGESEVERLIDLDGADAAALFGEGDVPVGLSGSLRDFDRAVVYSRNEALRLQLGRLVPDVIAVDPAPPPGFHAADWYVQPLVGISGPDAAAPPPLRPADPERAQADLWAKRLPPRFLAVHPGSGSPAKNWPASRFADAVRALSPGRAWLLVSGPADEDAAGALAREPGAVHARELPPRVLGALLSRAGLFLGNDSGVTHLAAAFGAPTLALFGPTDPAQWAPLGATALRGPGATMDGLEVEAVVAAARGLT
jgi:heptosyltransferase III